MAFPITDAIIAALLAATADVPPNLNLDAAADAGSIYTHNQLKARAVLIAKPTTMVIFSDSPTVKKTAQAEYSVGGETKDLNYITVYQIAPNPPLHNYRWLLHVEGSAAGVAVARLPNMAPNGPATCPLTSFQQLLPDMEGPNFGLDIQEDTHFVYALDVDMLRSFLQDSQVSMPSKIISWLYHMFPFSRNDLASVFSHNTVEYAHPEALNTDDYVAATAMLCLGPFYTQDNTWAQQVKRRLESAQAKGGFAVPDLTHFTNLTRYIMITDKKGFSHVDKAMGMVICQQRGGGANPMAPDSSLATVRDLFPGTAPDPLASTLFEQMRLVAQGHRQKTLAFGIAIHDIGADAISSINAAFARDVNNLQVARQLVDGRSYTGLQDPLPVALQIASFARPALVGVEYHRRHLANQAQQTQFALYVTNSISAHISPSSDAATCSHLANLLTPPTTASMVAIVSSMNDDEASKFLVGRSGSEIDDIYKEASRPATKCLWFVAENERRESVVLNKMADAVISPLLTLLANKARAFRNMPPPASLPAGVDWVSHVRDWEDDLSDLINDLKPGTRGIAVPSIPGFAGLKSDMEKRVKALIANITVKAVP